MAPRERERRDMADFEGWAEAVTAVIRTQLGEHVTCEIEPQRAQWEGPSNRATAEPVAGGGGVVRYVRGPEQQFGAAQTPGEVGMLIVNRLVLGA